MSRYPKKPGPKKPGKKAAAKKVAPKKAIKSKPIPQQVAANSARERSKRKASALPHVDVSERNVGFDTASCADGEVYGTRKLLLGEQRFIEPDLPAPPPTTKRSKFWRQYQDEFGKFIGWPAAMKLTKDQVISRLVLRKKPAPRD